jgi:hypothetical protein
MKLIVRFPRFFIGENTYISQDVNFISCLRRRDK